MTLSALPLPSSDLGTFITLASMRAMVWREYMSPTVRLTASGIVAGLGGQNGEAQAEEIRGWIDAHTEFLRDPDGAEMLHGPVWQIQQIQRNGIVQVDCDDVAMLAAALGKAVGLRSRFVAVAFDAKNAPFRHVWTELVTRQGSRVDVDVTRPQQGLPFDRITRVITREV